MLWILQAVADRLRALFATDVALGFEAEVATRHAARKAELLRQAQRYDAEGLAEIAAELRERVGALSLERPLASSLPGIDELRKPLPLLLSSGNPTCESSTDPAQLAAAGKSAASPVVHSRRRRPR